MHTEIWFYSPLDTDYLEGLGVNETIILKLILRGMMEVRETHYSFSESGQVAGCTEYGNERSYSAAY
jgi:hypothetical protein